MFIVSIKPTRKKIIILSAIVAAVIIIITCITLCSSDNASDTVKIQ